MAVIRQRAPLHNQHRDLVEKLSTELNGTRFGGQPFVYINNVAQTGTLHVTVVWDEWRNVNMQERSQIILDAMEMHDPATTGHITIALGLAGDEALQLGILPYQVRLLLKPSEEAKRPYLEQLLRTEGAFGTSQGLQLLFRTRQQAEEAYARLQAKTPDVWTISYQPPSPE
jgi:hypothetical protein